MTVSHQIRARIVRYQIIGVTIMIAISWFNEAIHLSAVLFGDPIVSGNWHEALLESIIIVAVAAPLIVMTNRILRRLSQLDAIHRVCSGCGKVFHDGRWLSLDEYLADDKALIGSGTYCDDCSFQAQR